MSRLTKVLVAVLLIIFIGVTIATLKFYYDSSNTMLDPGGSGEHINNDYIENGVGISSDRYIVSQGAGSLFGIIDKNENVIVPFMYESISISSSDIILGVVAKNKRSVIFDLSGNPYIAVEWDSCKINKNNIIFVKDGSEYNGRIKDGRLVFDIISLKKSFYDSEITINITKVEDLRMPTTEQ